MNPPTLNKERPAMSKLIFALGMALPFNALAVDVPHRLEPDGFSRTALLQVQQTATPACHVVRY